MRVWGMHERTNIQLSRTDRSQLKAVVANRNSARVAPDVRKRQQDSVFPTLSQPIDPLLQEHGLAVARGGLGPGCPRRGETGQPARSGVPYGWSLGEPSHRRTALP